MSTQQGHETPQAQDPNSTTDKWAQQWNVKSRETVAPPPQHQYDRVMAENALLREQAKRPMRKRIIAGGVITTVLTGAAIGWGASEGMSKDNKPTPVASAPATPGAESTVDIEPSTTMDVSELPTQDPIMAEGVSGTEVGDADLGPKPGVLTEETLEWDYWPFVINDEVYYGIADAIDKVAIRTEDYQTVEEAWEMMQTRVTEWTTHYPTSKEIEQYENFEYSETLDSDGYIQIGAQLDVNSVMYEKALFIEDGEQGEDRPGILPSYLKNMARFNAINSEVNPDYAYELNFTEADITLQSPGVYEVTTTIKGAGTATEPLDSTANFNFKIKIYQDQESGKWKMGDSWEY